MLASQDPVAVDDWAAKHVLYPIDENPRPHPDHEGIRRWLTSAERTINRRGGLFRPERGNYSGLVTSDESRMIVVSSSAEAALQELG